MPPPAPDIDRAQIDAQQLQAQQMEAEAAEEQVEAPSEDADLDGVKTDAMGKVILGAAVGALKMAGGAAAKVAAPVVAPIAGAAIRVGVAVGMLSYVNNSPAASAPQQDAAAQAPETPGMGMAPQQEIPMDQLIGQAIDQAAETVRGLSADAVKALDNIRAHMGEQMESVGASSQSMAELAPQDLGSNLAANVSQGVSQAQEVGRA